MQLVLQAYSRAGVDHYDQQSHGREGLARLMIMSISGLLGQYMAAFRCDWSCRAMSLISLQLYSGFSEKLSKEAFKGAWDTVKYGHCTLSSQPRAWLIGGVRIVLILQYNATIESPDNLTFPIYVETCIPPQK